MQGGRPPHNHMQGASNNINDRGNGLTAMMKKMAVGNAQGRRDNNLHGVGRDDSDDDVEEPLY